MKISRVIEILREIEKVYGDIRVTGGAMSEDIPLSDICVTDSEGLEVWPHDPNGARGRNPIDGVFLQ